MRKEKTDDLGDLYAEDLTREELDERRRIAAMARADVPNAPRRRPKRTFWQKYGVLICLGSFVLIMSGLISWVIDTPAREARAASESAWQARQNAANSAAALDTAAAGPARQTENFALSARSAQNIAQPENGRVELSYFDDALFIGDSLTQGMELYENGIKNAKFAAYIGISPKAIYDGTQVTNFQGEKVTAMDEIKAAPVSKIYILLGTNALPTLSDEAFIKYYNDMLDELVKVKPDCVFYIQAIPPAGAEKTEADANFALARINGLNEQLAQIAWERGMHYIDLYSALADDEGYLRAEWETGGFHLNNTGYGAWRDYLMTHTVYDKDAVWVAGSPAYRAAE